MGGCNHFVMRRHLVVAREVPPALLRNHRALVVLSRHGPNVVERVPENDRQELNFAAVRAPQQVAAAPGSTIGSR
jgi:hypothetical protein